MQLYLNRAPAIKNRVLKYNGIILSIFCCVLCFVGGFGFGHARAESFSDLPCQKLLVTAEFGSETTTVISSKHLNGHFNQGIQYLNCSNVFVEVNGISTELEVALRNDLISESDILYYARTDAQNGFCEEFSISTHGVTNYTYRYPGFDMLIVYDICETPANGQQFVSFMRIAPCGKAGGPFYNFHNPETGYELCEENWGLTFDLFNITPTGLSVQCTQEGGQQIGQLNIIRYMLTNDTGFISELNDDSSGAIHTMDSYTDGFPITTNSCTEFALDWKDVYGELPSGSYHLCLCVQDIFEKSEVHPLIVDFQSKQLFDLPFTIP